MPISPPASLPSSPPIETSESLPMPPLPPELPSGYLTPPKSPIIQPQATTPPPPLPTNQDPSMLSALGTAAPSRPSRPIRGP